MPVQYLRHARSRSALLRAQMLEPWTQPDLPPTSARHSQRQLGWLIDEAGGIAWRKSLSRLPTRSGCMIETPVTLPAGCAKLWTKPLRTGSNATAKTMGMDVIVCFRIVTAAPYVTMTSTLRRSNSAANSLTRSDLPWAQRYSIARLSPSLQD